MSGSDNQDLKKRRPPSNSFRKNGLYRKCCTATIAAHFKVQAMCQSGALLNSLISSGTDDAGHGLFVTL